MVKDQPMPTSPKELIESICAELCSAKGTQIARHYENALTLIAQVVFTRSSGFILEFIQNAEDAGLGLQGPGHFSIFLNAERLKIVHNACPFKEENVRAICGIQSSKRPERGTLGYLGIGFKSVFKVTTRPHIFSGGYHFKFDKSHWPDSAGLWRVLPIWVNQAPQARAGTGPEAVEPDKTTFIVPLQKADFYDHLAEDIKKLGTELYLFLRWLRRIEIHDEETGLRWSLENLGEDEEGITTLSRDGATQRFKFFRKAVRVPKKVQEDELTQQFRENVKQREIAIAFALDAEGNLAPSEAGAMYGGVYSFLPLGETSSGAKFPIQADFLVQPGRDAINAEAAWNHWLVEEVEKLCEEAIDEFKKHAKWKFQFLSVFANDSSVGEAYQQLFRPKLFEPLKTYLNETPCVPTKSGDWAKPDEVVRVDEEISAIEGLGQTGFLKDSEIGLAFVGEEKQLADPSVLDGAVSIRKVGRSGLLSNAEFLQAKGKEHDAPAWFRKLYSWLRAHPTHYTYIERRRTYQTTTRYHDFEIVLTGDHKVMHGGKVSLIDIPVADSLVSDLANELAKSRPVLHPDLLAHVSSPEEAEELKGFLTGFMGVQILDAKKVCEEALLPRILVGAPKPSADSLIRYTKDCRKVLGTSLPVGVEFWVATKEGHVRPAKETLLAVEYCPQPDWEPNQRYLGGLHFVSPAYIDGDDPNHLQAWRQFFSRGGVREAPEGGVEEFAVNYVREHLSSSCTQVRSVEKRKVGYDLEAIDQTGEVMRVEVKGQSAESPVELVGNEADAADTHGNDFFLFVVCGIPENPKMYRVRNPAAVGKKNNITIPVSVWKARRVQQP